MVALVQEMISILVSGITGIATGIGQGLGDLVKAIFLDVTEAGTTLSIFGGVILAFAGISLAIGLSRFVVNWVTSLGSSH